MRVLCSLYFTLANIYETIYLSHPDSLSLAVGDGDVAFSRQCDP